MEYIKIGMLPNCTDWMTSCLPKKTCNRSRKEVAMSKARNELAKETNIITIVQRQRFNDMAIRYLLTTSKRSEFIIQSKHLPIDPDSGTDYAANQLFNAVKEQRR